MKITLEGKEVFELLVKQIREGNFILTFKCENPRKHYPKDGKAREPERPTHSVAIYGNTKDGVKQIEYYD